MVRRTCYSIGYTLTIGANRYDKHTLVAANSLSEVESLFRESVIGPWTSFKITSVQSQGSIVVGGEDA
jgi:hypothetical protein